MIELLEICDYLRPTMGHVWYESDCFAVRYDKRIEKFTGMIIGTHRCEFEPDTFTIDFDTLFLVSRRDEELAHFLLEHRDVNEWDIDLLLYMKMKFEIIRT